MLQDLCYQLRVINRSIQTSMISLFFKGVKGIRTNNNVFWGVNRGVWWQCIFGKYLIEPFSLSLHALLAAPVLEVKLL